jgi:hypothetical protein
MTLYLVTSVSIAQPPRPNVYNDGNRWHITFFNDPTTIHQQWATQTLCFLPYSIVGTSIQGKWYSTTYPDWNGLYYQEGDEVKMTGDFWHDTGHDHMTLFHTTVEPKGMAFKDWTEWGEDDDYGFIFGWGNARLIRDGYCWLPHSGLNHLTAKTSAEIEEYEKEASELSKRLPQRLMRDGREAEFPGVPDQEDVATYLKRAGLGGPIQ